MAMRENRPTLFDNELSPVYVQSTGKTACKHENCAQQTVFLPFSSDRSSADFRFSAIFRRIRVGEGVVRIALYAVCPYAGVRITLDRYDLGVKSSVEKFI